MRIFALIPARLQATRFPEKLLQTIGNKTVIAHTYQNTVATGLFNEVWVVTDSERIFNEIVAQGGKAIMSLKPHESGSDRIAEAVAGMEVDIVVNVQGDEPMVPKDALEKLIAVFKSQDAETIQLASLMRVFKQSTDVGNPNFVKVVVDLHFNALYFSRAPVPYQRDAGTAPIYYHHIGVYAFRKNALLQFTQWPVSALEQAEKLEQLRYLAHGQKIRMVVVNYEGLGIDTPEDLERVRQIML